jgi:hypothetical protein
MTSRADGVSSAQRQPASGSPLAGGVPREGWQEMSSPANLRLQNHVGACQQVSGAISRGDGSCGASGTQRPYG